MKIANREMNLKDAIRNIKVMIEAQAEERKPTFPVSVAPEVGEFYYCYSLRLNQILLNLLSNALKYTTVKISDKKQKVRKLGETQHRETDRED